ncbi:integrase [Planomonospora sphaerica]|uniref:Integrase n=1 Tax=Planomonospora sphaerica TaxID=161355 RepID=A0A161MCI3_9ACTN|nr:tyrosine-type recombinase/integrase [Planomonospora sphaerica]GAT68933.1 integrase [Planomonospora sphaerica]
MNEHLPETTTAGNDALPARVTPVDSLRNPCLAYLASLDSVESKRTMRGCLDRIARILAGRDPNGTDPETGKPDPAVLAITGENVRWHLLRYEHAIRLRELLAEQTNKQGEPWSPAYRNKHLVALRQILDQAWQLGLMSAEEKDRAVRLDPFKGTRLPAGEHLPIERVGALLAECDADAVLAGPDDETPRERARRENLRRVALRDAAIIAVLYASGVRRAELAGLALADYDPAARSLRVRGMRDKERLVYITTSAVARVEAWLTVRGRVPGGLFTPFTPRGGHIRRDAQGRPAHMDGRTVGDVLNLRGEQAGVGPQAAHDFRRTFIGELLDAGVDLATAQALAGHASPTTTSRYDRRPERRRREAVDQLRTPPAVPLPGVARTRDRKPS